MDFALSKRNEACLVESAVRQAWWAGQGVDRDLVIGVNPSGDVFEAHAWLEGDRPPAEAGFTEITRRPAPRT